MIIERFPYANFHEMNLDWLLSEMKKLEQMVKSGDQNIMKEIDKINETIILIKNQIIQIVNEMNAQEQDITNIYNIIGFFIDPVNIHSKRLSGFIDDTNEMKVVRLV